MRDGRSSSGLFVGDDDDEDAMLAAAIEESKRTAQSGHTGAESSQKAREPESLTGGVAAALARLREQG
jgi:DNA excision repair protein ERCC-1